MLRNCSKFFAFILYLCFTMAEAICPQRCKCEVSNSATNRMSIVICQRASLREVPKLLPSEVTFVHLAFNEIKQIPSQMFVGYDNLEHVILSHNAIEFISENGFKNLHKLTRLDLSYNQISYFPWKIIHDLKRLETLNLEHNHIYNLPTTRNILQELNRMNSLHLRYNAFTCSCDILTFCNWLSIVYRLDVKRQDGVNVYIPHAIDLNCTSKFSWVSFPLLKLANLRRNMGFGRLGTPLCAEPVVTMSVCVRRNGNETSATNIRKLSETNEIEFGGSLMNSTLIDDSCTLQFKLISDTILGNLSVDYNISQLAKDNAINDKLNGAVHDLGSYLLEDNPGIDVMLSCHYTNKAIDSFLNDVTLKSYFFNDSFGEGRAWGSINKLELRNLSSDSTFLCGGENVGGTSVVKLTMKPFNTDTVKATTSQTIYDITSQTSTRNVKFNDFPKIGEMNLPDPEMNETVATYKPSFKKIPDCGNVGKYLTEFVVLTQDRNNIDKYRAMFGVFNVTLTLIPSHRDMIIMNVQKGGSFRPYYLHVCHTYWSTFLYQHAKGKDKETEIKIVANSFSSQFIVCFKISGFVQACGNFTVKPSSNDGMKVMAVIGILLISVGAIPLLVATTHHVMAEKDKGTILQVRQTEFCDETTAFIPDNERGIKCSNVPNGEVEKDDASLGSSKPETSLIQPENSTSSNKTVKKWLENVKTSDEIESVDFEYDEPLSV